MKTFFAACRDERLRLKLTQSEVAAAIGISRASLNAMETGQTERPLFEAAMLLSACLGVSIDDQRCPYNGPDLIHLRRTKIESKIGALRSELETLPT